MISRKVLVLNQKAIDLIHSMKYQVAEVVLLGTMAVLEQEHGNDVSDISCTSLLTQDNDDRDNCVMEWEGIATTTTITDLPTFEVNSSLSSSSSSSSSSSMEDSCCRGSTSTSAVPPRDDLSAFAVYDKTFAIPSNLSPTDQDCDYNFVYAILLYNNGLSLHLQGLVNAGDEKIFEQSLQSYETALGLAIVSGQRSLVHSLELALYNNCCHIHNFLLDTRNVTCCLERMNSLLHTLSATKEIRQEALSPFAYNLLYNSEHHLRPGPAA